MSDRRRITVDYTAPDDQAQVEPRPAGMFLVAAAVGAWLLLAAVVALAWFLYVAINFSVSVLTGS